MRFDFFQFEGLSVFLTMVFCVNTSSYRFGLRSTRQTCFDGLAKGEKLSLLDRQLLLYILRLALEMSLLELLVTGFATTVDIVKNDVCRGCMSQSNASVKSYSKTYHRDSTEEYSQHYRRFMLEANIYP